MISTGVIQPRNSSWALIMKQIMPDILQEEDEPILWMAYFNHGADAGNDRLSWALRLFLDGCTVGRQCGVQWECIHFSASASFSSPRESHMDWSSCLPRAWGADNLVCTISTTTFQLLFIYFNVDKLLNCHRKAPVKIELKQLWKNVILVAGTVYDHLLDWEDMVVKWH